MGQPDAVARGNACRIDNAADAGLHDLGNGCSRDSGKHRIVDDHDQRGGRLQFVGCALGFQSAERRDGVVQSGFGNGLGHFGGYVHGWLERGAGQLLDHGYGNEWNHDSLDRGYADGEQLDAIELHDLGESDGDHDFARIFRQRDDYADWHDDRSGRVLRERTGQRRDGDVLTELSVGRRIDDAEHLGRAERR